MVKSKNQSAMNKMSYLLGGILIGLTISHFLNKPTVSEYGQRTDAHETQSEIKPQKKPTSVTFQQTEKKKTEPSVATQNVFPPELKTQSTVTKLSEPPRQRLELTINEDLVQRLERNWTDLPRQAQLENEAGGWRVRFIDKDSLFAEIGLQPGDFISHQAIQNLKFANAGNSYLSDRVIRILNHVQ